jgi:hypothetical protein
LRRIFGPLKEDKGSGQRKFIIKAFINFAFHHTLIIKSIKSRDIIASICEILNAYNILVGKPEGRRSLGRGMWSSGGIL